MYVFSKKDYTVRVQEDGIVTFLKNKQDFFSVPACACVNDVYADMKLVCADDSEIVFNSDTDEMRFVLLDDCIRVRFSRKAVSDMPVYEARMFTNGKCGMEAAGFDRAFCPQPRNNAGKNMDYYHHLPDLSQNGYFSPPVMELTIGSCGGNKVIPMGELYQMPEILITFPKDEWEAVTVFRNKLIEFGKYTPSKPKYSELPEWWKNPFVCTYGNQLNEHRVGQKMVERI